MTKPEFTGKRPSVYSRWHRTISPDCCATDIDFLEYRYRNEQLVIVAIIEEKDFRGCMDARQKAAYLEASRLLNVPAYLLRNDCEDNPNNPELWRFEITDIRTDEILHHQITTAEMKRFLEAL